jgi:hypothetical protein
MARADDNVVPIRIAQAPGGDTADAAKAYDGNAVAGGRRRRSGHEAIPCGESQYGIAS